MKQAPAWLPYRLRKAIDDRRIARALAPLDRTAPRPAADPKDACAELFMLVCRRDAKLAVLALKSLLRFRDKLPLAVTLTDDGSLTGDVRQWIDAHVPNCRWLSVPGPRRQLDDAFNGRPRLAALYAGGFLFAAKLIHPIALPRTPRSIVLDSDTAFFAEPTRLVAWCRATDRGPLYLHDHQDEASNIPPNARQALAELEAAVTPDGATWRMAHRFFNAGLLLFEPGRLDLDLAERFLTWRDSQPAERRRGAPGLWLGDWGIEQTSYHVMFALSTPPAQPLGDDYHLGGQPGHVFNHFLRHYLVKDQSLRMLGALIAEL